MRCNNLASDAVNSHKTSFHREWGKGTSGSIWKSSSYSTMSSFLKQWMGLSLRSNNAQWIQQTIEINISRKQRDHTTALRISTRFSDFVACLAKITRKSNLFDRQPGRQKILTTDRNRRHCPFKFFTQVAISTTFWRRWLAVCNNTTV